MPLTQMLHRGPRFCLEDHPTGQSISFGGRYINLQKLSDMTGCNHPYLSKIFSGERRGSVDYLERMSDGLGMTLGDFRFAMRDHYENLKVKLYVIPVKQSQ